MKSTYQNGKIVKPVKNAYVFNGVSYSNMGKAYKAMIGDNPELYVRSMSMIETSSGLSGRSFP
jgi:hypothetical protein